MTRRPSLYLLDHYHGRRSRKEQIASRIAKQPRERVTSDFFDMEDLFVAHRVETKSAIMAAIINRRNR